MRFIQVELPLYYKEVIKQSVDKHPNIKKFDFDFLQDLMFVVAQGYDAMWGNMCSVLDLIRESSNAYIAGRIRNMRLYEAELYTLRLDLIDFADCDFARALKDDPVLKLEEKFEFMAMVLDTMVASHSTPQDVKNEMAQAAKEGDAKSGEVKSGENGAQATTSAGMSMTSRFFKGFSFMLSHMFEIHDSKREAGIGKGYSRVDSAVNDMFKESQRDKLKIADMVNKLWQEQYLKMFQIAHNLEVSFGFAKKGKLYDVDHVATNMTTARMHKMKDVSHAVKLDMALDEVFDRKVMTKQMRVQKFRERKDQKQCLYALLDCSGSTSDMYNNGMNRISFIKACAIALGKKALVDNSVFYFRWFDTKVRDVFILKERGQWASFLSHILNTGPSGGTNIDLALHVAVQDIDKQLDGMDKSDMVVITDGTQDLNNHVDFLEYKKRGLKFHFIILEDMPFAEHMKAVAESFQSIDLDKVESLDDYVPEMRQIV